MAELLVAMNAARHVVIGILHHKAPDDVDDVLQEAALKAFVHRRSFRGEAAYKTWFMRIAINTAIMHLKKLSYNFRSGGEQLDDSVLVEEFKPEEMIEQQRRAEAVRVAIDKLTARRRYAALRWLYGESTLDSAEKAARHHAKIKLREELRWLN